VAPRDILVVSSANTTGWRVAAEELAGSLARAGADVEVVTAKPSRRVRTFMLTDLVQARAAREAARRGIAAYRPRAIVYCSMTAALLWPSPGAIYLDALAAENRPGRHGVWQRFVERRRLGAAPLVLAWSEGTRASLPPTEAPAVVLPVPIEPVAGLPPEREIAAVTYAGDPVKRQLPLVLDAWRRARRPGETLIVTGSEASTADGVRSAGTLTPAEFRQLLARARVYIAAPRREEYGVAALEALAAGCLLVTSPAPGGYPALELARQLDARLIDGDLARAIRLALDDPRPGYADRASKLLAPFSRAAVDETVAHQVLPRLLNA
jgi:glycosyltransferase involved in cell wall biosynthesis